MKLVKTNLLSLLFLLVLPLNFTNAQQLDHQLGKVIIQTERADHIDRIIASLSKLRGQKTGLEKIRPLKTLAPIYLLRFDHKVIHEQELLTSLRRNPLVVFAQFNHLLTYRQTIPNDPSFSNQWFWINKDGVSGAIDADSAWSMSTGGMTPDGKEIVVAIVDNGIDLQHDDLKNNLWTNENEVAGNGVDDDNNGYIDDVRGWNINSDDDEIQADENGDGHGVTVAGMVGAVGNNSIGITGVNWGIKIMTIKNADGASQAIALESYAYILAMRKLYNETNGQRGAFIVSANTSWGLNFATANDAPIWCNFYNLLGEEGVVSCAATTNLSTNVDINGDLPTTCPSDYLIAVTRTGREQEQAGGFGPINIDLGAPGIDIYSTEKGNAYGFSTGTSLSSPLVAGMVAFLYSIPDNVLYTIADADPATAASLSRDYILNGVLEVPGFQNLVASKGIANLGKSAELVQQDAEACLAPFGLKIISRTDVEVTLGWTPGNNVTATNLRWRSQGSSDWTDEGFVDPPFLIQNLSPCNEYEFQVSSKCEGLQSAFSEITLFASDGCCTPPENIIVEDITTNEANISWESIFAGLSYDLEYREEGTTDWIKFSTPETTIQLNNLNTCTTYELRVKTICTGEISDESSVITFNTFGCGKCEDAPYCEIIGDTESEYIDKVVVAGVENSSGDNGGYASFFGLPIELDPGATYDLELTPGYPGFAYTEDFYVWIDYNQDGDFEDTNEAVLFLENTNTPVDSFFTVPANAFSGNTRMRITIFFFESTEPCTSPKDGETEDYCINITGNNLPCVPPDDLASEVLDDFSALLSWSPASDADKYIVSWKESIGSNWQQSTTTNASFLASGLNSCTNYDFRVSSECDGTVGDFSDPVGFKTKCKTGVTDFEQDIKFKVFPNPFDQELSLSFASKTTEELAIQLMDVKGTLIISKTLISGISQYTLPTANLLSGVYLLKIQSEKGQTVKKVLKVK